MEDFPPPVGSVYRRWAHEGGNAMKHPGIRTQSQNHLVAPVSEELPSGRFSRGIQCMGAFFLPALVILLSGIGAKALARDVRKEREVRVEQFAPQGEVRQATNFTLVFSRSLVDESRLGEPVKTPPVKFNPSIAGRFQWIAPDKLRFYPSVLLSPSTHYTAEVSPDLGLGRGRVLSGPNRFLFHTATFHVNSASLVVKPVDEEGKKDVVPDVQVQATVEFNYAVHPEEAARYLSIGYEDGSTVPFRLKTRSASRVLTLEARGTPRADDEKLSLKVSQGLFCIGCNVGLVQDYVKGVNLPQTGLKVEDVSPVRETLDHGYVRIAFNLPVNPNIAAPYVSVSPALSYRLSSSHHYLDLKGDFKVGETYQVTLRQGLHAIDGTSLKKDFSSAVTLEKTDLPPQIGFVGDGYYLTRSGNLNIGLSTINVSKIEMEVERIFENNLAYLLNATDELSDEYLGYREQKALGKKIRTFEKEMPQRPNEEVVTPLSVKEYLETNRPGVFRFTAREVENRWRQSSRWVLVTDMGIVAKKAGEDLWVWVHSLTTLDAASNAEVGLVSENNQLLDTSVTDESGMAVFKNYTRFKDEFVPYLVTVAKGEDFSFLQLARGEIPVSDFDVGGMSYLEHGYEAFVYDERGVYRPGETVHLASVVRGPDMTVAGGFPVRLKVTGPDGKVFDEQKADLNPQGAVELAVGVPDYAKTGKYVATVLLGEKEELGRGTFSVEEFVPDRMKVKLKTDREEYGEGDNMTVGVEGLMLFGPPAAGRRVQADVAIQSASFSPPGWKSFTFADHKKSFSTVRTQLDEATLDGEGRHSFVFPVPRVGEPPSSLKGVVSATVLEPGGRGVSQYAEVAVHPYDAYVGLKRPEEGYATPGQAVPVEFVVVDPEGAPLDGRTVEVTFRRVYWHSILKRDESTDTYRYVSEKVEEKIKEFAVRSERGAARFEVVPEEYGAFVVVARDAVSGGSASLAFYASGWGYAPWAMDRPGRVELDLERETYLPGETARVQVRAPFPGKLILTVEREKVLHWQTVDLKENTATLSIPVREEYKPNAYVSVHLVRSTESLERDAPVRAFGVAPFKVNTEKHRLEVTLSAPEEMRPKTPLAVDVQVRDSSGAPRGEALLTLAAVDEGICQLTDFRTPDAYGYFYGKKRLSVESYDTYGAILPEVKSSLSSPSGGAGARRRHLSPAMARRVKPVAFWSGWVRTDAEGKATVRFDIPQFNGTVRLMACVLAGSEFGKAEKPVLVRDPIVLTPTFPRFVGSTDRFVVPVSLFNGTRAEPVVPASGPASSIAGPDNETAPEKLAPAQAVPAVDDDRFEVRLSVQGPVRLVDEGIRALHVPKGEEKAVSFVLEARKGVGKASFTVSAKGNGEQTEATVEAPVRPPVPFTTLFGRGAVTEEQPASFALPAEWVEGTAEFSLTLSSFPAVRFASSLQYLLGYPHGCVEQTASKLFPLLYFDDLAKTVEPALFRRTAADYFIEEGIARLGNMQQDSGDFSFWPEGGDVNGWASIYAAHFLVEARKAGHGVPDRVHSKMLEALARWTRSYSLDDRASCQRAVYACYVLALAGRPEKSTMLYFKNNALDRLPDDSQFQLAGAFAHAGDRATALEMLPETVPPPPEDSKRESGGNFNSRTRSRAIMLDVLAHVAPGHPLVPVLVRRLMDDAGESGRWGTTQENAYAFLALGKILRQREKAAYTGVVAVGSEVLGRIRSGEDHRFQGENWGGRDVSVSVQGPGTCYYQWRADGLPSTLAVDEFDRDLVVRRRYLDRHGAPADTAHLRQGDLLIGEITVQALHEDLENVAVVDLLPTGLEIENPRLQSRKGIDWIGSNAYKPAYMDIRDDRLVLYGDFESKQAAKFYYGLRAVTEGTFVLPSIRGEAMYAPTRASVASSGRVTVVRPGEGGPGE